MQHTRAIVVRGFFATLMLIVLALFATTAINTPGIPWLAIVVCLSAWGGIGCLETWVLHRIERNPP